MGHKTNLSRLMPQFQMLLSNLKKNKELKPTVSYPKPGRVKPSLSLGSHWIFGMGWQQSVCQIVTWVTIEIEMSYSWDKASCHLLLLAGLEFTLYSFPWVEISLMYLFLGLDWFIDFCFCFSFLGTCMNSKIHNSISNEGKKMRTECCTPAVHILLIHI